MEGIVDEECQVIDSVPDWVLETSFDARESGQPDLFATCIPSTIDVITIFSVGRRIDRVQKRRIPLVNNVIDVEQVVQDACENMPQYKFVTVSTMTTNGTVDPKIESVGVTDVIAWPETVYGLAKLDCLLIIARKKPRICMTKRHLISHVGSRRTRKKPMNAKIERV